MKGDERGEEDGMAEDVEGGMERIVEGLVLRRVRGKAVLVVIS